MWIQRNKRLVINLSVILFLLIVIYTLMMIMSYLIPNEWIEENLNRSLELIQAEEKRWMVMRFAYGTKLDTFTDNLIFNKLTNETGLPVVKAAFWNNGYLRYWLGDIAILRPLLIFFHYGNIRYLNIFMIFSLMYLVLNQIKSVLGNTWAMWYLTVHLLMHFWIFPLSLQYTPVYVITQVTVLSYIYLYLKKQLTIENCLYISIICGSVTNFFDLLTAPLLTFGIPWVICFVLNYKQNQQSPIGIRKNYFDTILIGSSWLIGYLITWISKWLLATIFLGENVWQNVKDQITLRTVGGVEETLDVLNILKNMWKYLLPNEGKFIILIWIAFLMIYFFKKRNISSAWFETTPLLLMAIVPFVWVVILQNHNQHHFYFTYRLFGLTLFSTIGYFIINLPELNKEC